MDRPLHILYLSYDGLSDPLGQSQILPYLLGLSSMGHSFTLITFEKKDKFEALKYDLQNKVNEAQMTWLPLPYSNKPPVLSTIRNLFKMKKAVAQIIKAHPVDIIHCRSYLSMLVAEKFKQNCKVLFDMRGLWADERVEGGLWPQSSMFYRAIYRFFIKKERSFIQDCDALVSLSENGLDALSERYPELEFRSKSEVIPCCVDTLLFDINQNYPDIRKKNAWPTDKKMLVHLGSVGTWYLLKEELDFFSELRRRDPSWFFVILTSDTAAAQKIVDDSIYAMGSSIFIHAVPFAEVPAYLAPADALIFLIKPSFSKRASFPVKLAEAMALGIPVIANQGIGDIQDILSQTKAGLLIDPYHPKPADFYKVPNKAENIQRWSVYAQVYFGVQVGVKKYNDLYLKIA